MSNEQKKTFNYGEDLVAYAPINLPIGTACANFSNLYMYAGGRGKEHLRVHPDNFRIHVRTFINGNEVAITDDPKHVFVAGTQFWSMEDTFSIYEPELDVTITAPHGFDISDDELMPAIKKLQEARSIIDSAKEGTASGNLSDDDGLHVHITVVSTNYCTKHTIFEKEEDNSLVFAACDRRSLGKINGNGYEQDDFAATFRDFMDLHHMWIYLRVLLGYEYPYVTVFNIGDSNIEWPGIPEDNNAE